VDFWTPIESLDAGAGEESASTVDVDGKAQIEMTQEIEPSPANRRPALSKRQKMSIDHGADRSSVTIIHDP
jgi:hypothetical protein